MSDGPTIEFRSPYLTASQKASLKLIEQGLLEGAEDKCQEGLRTFFEVSCLLTERAIQRFSGEANLATLEAVAEDPSSHAQPLQRVLWESSTLTPFAQRFLRWTTRCPDEQPIWTVEDLNAYLQLSAEFYASLSDEDRKDVWLAPSLPSASHNSFDLVETGEELESRLEALLEEPWDSSELLFPVTEEPLASIEEPGQADQPKAELPGDPDPEPKGPRMVKESRAATPPATPEANSGFSHIEGLELPQSPLSPLEERSQLVVKKKYIGYGKNEDGVLGYCGQLTVSRFDDRALKGQLESSNPLLFFSPQALRGSLVTVTYWMPPAAFPQPGGHLTVRNDEQNKVLPISSLFPRSRTDFLKSHQVLTLLLAPSVLGLLYFCFVYVLSVNGVIGQVKELFPEIYTAALRGSAALDFRSQGVGLYQLEVVPTGESLSLIWAALIWICPLIATKFFRHLSRDRQRDLGGALAFALLLPSFGIVGMWNLQKILFPLLDHPDFGPLDLRAFLSWSVPLNLLASVYLFLSVHGVWDRKIAAKEMRFLLPLVLSGGYIVVTFLLIFGRSWTG